MAHRRSVGGGDVLEDGYEALGAGAGFAHPVGGVGEGVESGEGVADAAVVVLAA